MKILVTNYTFDASEQTVTFTDFNPVVLEKVLLITNVTDNLIIYNFADSTKGGTVTGASAVLTLTYDTTAMADADDLQIWYDDTSLSGDTSDLATSAKQLADNHNVTVSNPTADPETGLATSANQQSDALTDTELRATAVPISGTVTAITNDVSIDDGGNTITVDGTVTATMPASVIGPAVPTIDSYTSDDVNLAANTANQSVISAPGADKQIWVYGLIGTVDVAGSISIQDEDNVAHSGIMPVGITGGFVMNPSGNFSMPWIKVATNKALEIDTVTCTFDGIIVYAIVSV